MAYEEVLKRIWVKLLMMRWFCSEFCFSSCDRHVKGSLAQEKGFGRRGLKCDEL